MTGKHSFGGGSNTVLDQIPQPPCAAFLGYEFLSVDREAQTMRVAFQGVETMQNPRGGVQGGFLTAMMDDVMGSMVVVLTDGAKGPSSVDIHTQFFKPAGMERLICEAELIKLTKTMAFTRATIFNEAGERIAAASQSARLFDFPAATR